MLATKLYWQRKGKPVYLFTRDYKIDKFIPISLDADDYFWYSFDNDTPDSSNEYFSAHYLTNSPDDRTDPDLIAVVEELGPAASGSCAKLKIVEIPDGINWKIDEYDGYESVEEVHRSWS